MKPSLPISESATARTTGSSEVGRIASLAYGNQKVVFEVRTSNPFFRLLKLTLPIFTARPPIDKDKPAPADLIHLKRYLLW